MLQIGSMLHRNLDFDQIWLSEQIFPMEFRVLIVSVPALNPEGGPVLQRRVDASGRQPGYRAAIQIKTQKGFVEGKMTFTPLPPSPFSGEKARGGTEIRQ